MKKSLLILIVVCIAKIYSCHTYVGSEQERTKYKSEDYASISDKSSTALTDVLLIGEGEITCGSYTQYWDGNKSLNFLSNKLSCCLLDSVSLGSEKHIEFLVNVFNKLSKKELKGGLSCASTEFEFRGNKTIFLSALNAFDKNESLFECDNYFLPRGQRFMNILIGSIYSINGSTDLFKEIEKDLDIVEKLRNDDENDCDNYYLRYIIAELRFLYEGNKIEFHTYN